MKARRELDLADRPIQAGDVLAAVPEGARRATRVATHLAAARSIRSAGIARPGCDLVVKKMLRSPRQSRVRL